MACRTARRSMSRERWGRFEARMTAKLRKISPAAQTDAPPRRQAMKQAKIDLIDRAAVLDAMPTNFCGCDRCTSVYGYKPRITKRAFLAIRERVLALLNQQQQS